MTTPMHAYDRQKKAFELVNELAKLAGGIKEQKIAYLVHDIRTDIHHLTRQAEYWQKFCRTTGQNPFKEYEKNP